MLFISEKLISDLKWFFKKAIAFEDANIMGVQNSKILESSNVFKTTSPPIPFKSPIDIPTIIFSAFFIKSNPFCS